MNIFTTGDYTVSFPNKGHYLTYHKTNAPSTQKVVEFAPAITTGSSLSYMMAYSPPILIQTDIKTPIATDPNTQSPSEMLDQVCSHATSSTATAHILEASDISHEIIHYICMRATQLTLQDVKQRPVLPWEINHLRVITHSTNQELPRFFAVEHVDRQEESILETRPFALFTLIKHGTTPAINRVYPLSLKTNLPRIKAALEFYDALQAEIENTPPPWEE